MFARVVVMAAAICLLAMPSISAQQPVPVFKITARWAMDHEHTLDADGRDDMTIIVDIYANNWTCASPLAFKVDFIMDAFDTNLYGASTLPAGGIGPFEIPAGEPGVDGWTKHD